MFLLSTKNITHFETVIHTQLERSITRIVKVNSSFVPQWTLITIIITMMMIRWVLWWSDECVRATDLWAESDGSGWAAPRWCSGEIVLPTPTIIWWSWSCSRWWLWSLSQWWSCGWAALLWPPVIIIIVLFGKRPHLSTFLCTLLIMIRIFMITTIKLIKTMLITWMEGRRRELYSQKRHHEVSVSYFPTLSTWKCVSPLCRFKFLL